MASYNGVQAAVSAGLGAGWSSQCPCWRLKILAWLAVIHAVTRRSCAGHLSIGASRGFHCGTRKYLRVTLPVSASTCGWHYLWAVLYIVLLNQCYSLGPWNSTLTCHTLSRSFCTQLHMYIDHSFIYVSDQYLRSLPDDDLSHIIKVM